MDSLDTFEQEPDNRKRVEVANGSKPSGAEEDTTAADETPVKTLTQRMAAIRAEASGVGKEEIKMATKAGKEYTIQAHTIEGVLHGIRPLFDRHGVWIWPQLIEATFTGNRCDAKYEYEFENVHDKDDTKIVRWAGSGADNSDKGFSKAGTNAIKEMLKKVLLITDREDAKEETDKVEFRTDEGATRAEVDEAVDQAKAAIFQWANTFKSAMEGAQSLKEVRRLKRESHDQLNDENLPKVTKDFFDDLIKKKEAEFKPAE